jgi:hypothetical protein
MDLWEIHEVYKYFNVEAIYWYLNKYPLGWWEDFSKFDGDPSLAITHIVKFSNTFPS